MPEIKSAERGLLPHPLDGIRIIDLTSVMMGPYATQALADYGADVVKIESPEGDIMRHAGYMKHPGMGPLFLHANRNKRSIVVDLKQQRAREVILDLARGADMLVHNMRPAAIARLGLDYEAVAAVHPGIVYLELVGFDQHGPYAKMPAYDDVIQGACGLPMLHAMATGNEPAYVPVVVVDRVCGIHAAQVALAALLMKERTGQGQRVQVPMFETMVQMVMGDHLGGETFVPPAGPVGYSRLLTRDRRPYRTRDGYVALLIYTDGQWERFLEAIGRRDTLDDPRFATASARAQNYDVIYPKLTEWLQERTTREWVDLLQQRDIACMPLGDPNNLIGNAHLNAIDFFHKVEHPSEGTIRSMRVVSSWSGADVEVRRHAPLLGEQTVEILREAGFAQDRIDGLLKEGVVTQA